MAFKKITLISILPCCFKPKNPSSDPKINGVSNQISSPHRLSFSDLSNPGSPRSVLSDLSSSLIGSNLNIFSLAELKVITQSFSSSNYLGEGGFGQVHKGFIDDKLRPGLEAQPVAVKVLNLDGTQGHREWLAEVLFLGQLRHSNLVKLIGYCCEDEHRLLVYEYMARDNLDSQLLRRYSTAPLPWLTRIKIAVGAAKGLAFLHEEEKPVIHRDFKASNILLDADYNAKLSDFGLAIDGPERDGEHVSTPVMGTEGYAAPEYIATGHLTTMSDVYSFGVVLLELLTGRRSVDKTRPSRKRNLVQWARPLLKDRHKLDQIMDPRLEGQFSAEGAKKAAMLAHQCLSHHPKCRPTMSHVVKTLESVMELDDIPVGPFVYIVPMEGEMERDVQKNVKESEEKEVEERSEKENGHRWRQNGHRHRRKRSLRSGTAYSEAAVHCIQHLKQASALPGIGPEEAIREGI